MKPIKQIAARDYSKLQTKLMNILKHHMLKLGDESIYLYHLYYKTITQKDDRFTEEGL